MDPFVAKLTAKWPPAQWQDVSLLVACSGGADSVALLRGLHALKHRGAGRLIVGHFHHGLREQADADAQFVQRLSAQLDLPCQVGHGDVAARARQQGDGLEEAARHDRYEFLQSIAEQHGARYVATAHTADDQIETILHRILRGTGVAGLRGIPRVRVLSQAVTLIRPLLEFRRAEIQTYLESLGQEYCHDESNLDTSLTRNRIRHDLLPFLADQFNPAVDDALLRLGQLASEAQTIIDQWVDDYYDCCVTQSTANEVLIDCDQLKTSPPYLVREIGIRLWQEQHWPLQDMGRAQWEQLSDLVMQSSSEKITLPGAVTAQKKDGQLALRRP
jgi:tRNA(Ile)-lysidine synthase